jgi:hypothetical protein
MNIRALYRICVGIGAALFAVAALPAQAEPALWKIKGRHATIYLFGTVHALKKGTNWRSPRIEAAFASSDVLWEEIANPDDRAAAEPLLARYGQDPGHPLSSKLGEAGRAKLAAVEASYGLPPSQIEPLRPWLAALNLNVIPIVKAGYDPRSGVEFVLKNLAVAQGKPIQGFETIDQQLRFFADLPQQLEVDYLLATLDEVDKGPAQLDRKVTAWLAGDTAGYAASANANLFKRFPQLYRILLVQRNRAFAARIEQLLKGNSNVFVAVGADHLAGSDSVLADLARDGIRPVRQ